MLNLGFSNSILGLNACIEPPAEYRTLFGRRRNSRRWSAFDQFCFQFEFLIGDQINIRVERLIARQRDRYMTLSGSHQQSFADSVELGHVTNEDSIDQDGGTVGAEVGFDS